MWAPLSPSIFPSSTVPNPARPARAVSSSRLGLGETPKRSTKRAATVSGSRSMALFQFLQQVAAEAAQGLAHSSSLLPVNFSYISTMNRLALTVRGPSGRVPTRKAGSSSTKR